MTQNVKAIVIKSNDRKEKDKNILLFSLEQGKIWATLKGVKSPNAKMKIAQNPFCFGEFILEDCSDEELIILRQHKGDFARLKANLKTRKFTIEHS